jgi:guanylate kinase
MGRLILLSGPSCVGKGPLCAAVGKFYPEAAAKLKKLVMYNSRAPRPAEIDGRDYHFRSREEIESYREREGFVVLDVRGDLQALAYDDVNLGLASGDLLFEGNPFVARELQRAFMSRVAREEILHLRSLGQHLVLDDFVTDVMRRKLLRRTQRQKEILSLKDLENIERRASSACTELKEARYFDHVIPNHDGEDSENWDAFYHPVGDARRTLLAFVDLLSGEAPACDEKWEDDLLP